MKIILKIFCLFFGVNSVNAAQRPNIFFFFADDWGKYASVYKSYPPNKAFKTPVMDKFAEEGILFTRAHVPSPSCTPCRSSLLSGQYFYRTGLGAFLHCAEWDLNIPSYPLLLEKAGYHIGFTYKAWGPGSPSNAPYGGAANAYQSAGRRFNQFSKNVVTMVEEGKTIEEAKEELYNEGIQNFRSFMSARDPGQPFCYWFGPTATHRSGQWPEGSGKYLWGLNPDDLKGNMPAFIPDVPEIRDDMCDYLGQVLALDNMLKRFLEELEEIGERENTIIVLSGDHGVGGFPRAKCNLYPFGTEVALFIQWPGVVRGERVIDDFINLMDLAPTFLDVAGEPVPEYMTGKSLLPLLLSNKSGQIDMQRDYVVTGRERHVPTAREGELPYPQRAIQTKDYLYIRNFMPDRDPVGYWPEYRTEPTYEELKNNTRVAYADFDASPTKAWMIKHRNDERWDMQWMLGFEKRPEEELYDLNKDPDYINNVAYDEDYAAIKRTLSNRLMDVLESTGDPRVKGDGKTFERPPYVHKRE